MARQRNDVATFSEGDVQRIIERATEIESGVGTRLTLDELRQIATHAGIDAEALDRAIREVAVSSGAEPARRSTSVPVNRIALLIGTGVSLGVLALAADRLGLGELSAFAVLGPSALYSVFHALRHRMRDGVSSLLHGLAIVFGSFTVAIMASDGFKSAALAVGWSVMCAGLARAIVALRGHTNTPTTELTPNV